MPNAMPATSQEGMMKLLQQLAAVKAAPDADLDMLGQLEQTLLEAIRRPFDTASPGSPAAAGAATDLSGMPPGGPGVDMGSSPDISPMIAALMGGGGMGGGMGGGGMGGGPAIGPNANPAAPGSFPTTGLMAATPQPPTEEIRRLLNTAGGRNAV